MAYVSVAEWRPEQVTEWLKGLDVCVTPYLHWFSNNEVNGQQLLNLSPDELSHLGVHKIGHQELILDAVEHLRNFHYELDRENLQLLALRVSCAAHSLYNEIKHKSETTSVPTQTMADVSNVINHVKPLVSWLDRPPFSGQIEYAEYKSQLLSISLEMATCAQRDTFAERPISEIRNCSSKLAKLADYIIQDVKDPMLLQPASLDLATIKKRVGEDLGFFLIPSFHGIHQISDMKLSSPAHQSGKIQPGDEIVQVNYQTVVGWSRKKVLALFDESPNDLLLTLKRRPRHVKMYGQVYMKPYRLPSRKRASPYSRWNDNVPSPRPELLTLPHFDIPRILTTVDKSKKNEDILSEPSGTSSSSDEEFGQATDSQNAVPLRLYLPKPRAPIQRRFTLSGPPRPSAQSEQFWRELQLERSWRSNQNNSQMNNSNSGKLNKVEDNVDEIFHLRDKSASLGNSIGSTPARPSTCINFMKSKMGNVKFDLPKVKQSTLNTGSNDKFIAEERDKTRSNDTNPVSATSVEKKINLGAEVLNGDIMNITNKMTISEINKIKRDAFFSTMDSSNMPKCINEDSSDKVKRIIENFKSEVSNFKLEITEPDITSIPGKVSQLIGSFERKEVQQNVKGVFDKSEIHCSPKVVKNRECLSSEQNKSQIKVNEESTEIDSGKENQWNKESLKHMHSEPPDIIRSSLSRDALKSMEQEHSSVIVGARKDENLANTAIDHFPPFDRQFCSNNECSEFKTEDCARFDQDDDISNTSDYEYTAHPEAREIVDTVNLALVELKQRQDHYDVRDKQKEEHIRNALAKDISSCNMSSLDRRTETTININHDTELRKPIPMERKSKITAERNKEQEKPASGGSLPPKPRPRTTEKIAELRQAVKPPFKCRTAPEPPPRPESTFTKVLPSRKELSENTLSVSEIRKGSIAISPPISVNAGSPFNLSTVSNDASSKFYELKQVPSPNLPARELMKPNQNARAPASSSILNVITEKPKSSGGTLESLKAMLSLGRKPLNFSSPRSVRKKNAMLARKRNVSVKDVSPGDNSGILWHRNRKGTAIAPWSKFFFVLQGPNFYGFRSKDSQKADLFIHLPGFTCTPAEEVKSKEFAFKIYHTGTAFYFGANSSEDLQQWLDCVSLATICPDDKQIPETVTFSVSDSDLSDPEIEPETCFPTSPKMKKFLGSSPVPKPARSHQNLASDSKKSYDIQKRFGSLKKLSSQKNSAPNHHLTSAEPANSAHTEIASLDRKYLRFLGHKNTPQPVPTSQFRSYRRMQPSVASTVHGGKLNDKNEVVNKHLLQSNREQSGLVRKTLHLSNPSLIHPDMADYRITQERLAEFRRLRNRENTQEVNDFMTLEQFMTSRQEEALMRSNRRRPPELRGFMTLEQFLLSQEEERQLSNRSNRIREKPISGNETMNEYCIQPEEEKRLCNMSKISRPYSRTDAPVSGSVNENVMRGKACTFDNALDNVQVKPRIMGGGSKHSVTSSKCSWKTEDDAPSNSSTVIQDGEDCSCAACESSLMHGMTRKNNTIPHSSEEDEPKVPDILVDPTPDYPGIEYPPAFEPETYTLQYMLKDRRKRSSNKNKRDDR